MSARIVPGRARGITLVEVMVAMVIGLMIALAAGALYLGVRENSRSIQALSDINQTGKLALDIVGREIEKAGFYPAEVSANAAGASNAFIGAYVNIKNPTAAAPLAMAFNQGLFGCTGATFDPTKTECAAPADSKAPVPDSIVINYFSSPEFGANALMGNNNDCNRASTSNDAANAARGNLPLFVSNRFALVRTKMTGPDGAVSTYALGCNGNGTSPAVSDYQPLLQGIDDMVIVYGVRPKEDSPTEFRDASSMTAALWPRVKAVRLCFIVRSIDSNVRQAGQADEKRSKPSCRNSLTNPPAELELLAKGDRSIYKKFEQVFGTRNYTADEP